jgi:hypothetical protein
LVSAEALPTTAAHPRLHSLAVCVDVASDPHPPCIRQPGPRAKHVDPAILLPAAGKRRARPPPS